MSHMYPKIPRVMDIFKNLQVKKIDLCIFGTSFLLMGGCLLIPMVREWPKSPTTSHLSANLNISLLSQKPNVQSLSSHSYFNIVCLVVARI